ncbi:MAG: hypothetical protein LBT99_03740 [Bifidobacteriaceae bacterium]|jgi:glutaredoxin|nr:hypothetical protein [Bifidobacteriaceae bacterium]
MKIKVFTKPNCNLCIFVKQHLIKNNIKFDELPITDAVINLFKDKAKVLPIITVDDKYFSHGFDRKN